MTTEEEWLAGPEIAGIQLADRSYLRGSSAHHIERFSMPGEYSFIPWIRVHDYNRPIFEISAHKCEGIWF